MTSTQRIENVMKEIEQMNETELHAVAVLALSRLYVMELEHRESDRTVIKQQTQVRLGVWERTLTVRG